MNDICYFITHISDGDFRVYSIKVDSVSNVLLFSERDDAERYVIMLEQDDAYIVGENFTLEVTEAPLVDVVDSLNEKGHDYIFVKSDDLFIPPY